MSRRLMIDLKAEADAAYDSSYHHKLRGRIWRGLEGSPYEDVHDSDGPLGVSWSNPFPFGEISEGDRRHVIVASQDEGVLSHLAQALKQDPEFNIGEMPFKVDNLRSVTVDAGEPGTRGVLETGTGVLVRLYEEHRDEYDIEGGEVGSPTYWRPEHSVEPFFDAITDNLQTKHERFAPDYVPGPAEIGPTLFEGYELIKTYALPVTVTSGVEINLILSKWRFNYEVRDDTHRKHLNLMLDTGVGGRNGLGFGFVNIDEKVTPRGEKVAFS